MKYIKSDFLLKNFVTTRPEHRKVTRGVFFGGICSEYSLSEEVPVKTQDTSYILSRCINLLLIIFLLDLSSLLSYLLLQHLRFYSFLQH